MTHATPRNLLTAEQLITNHGIRCYWLKSLTTDGWHYYGLSYHVNGITKNEHLAFAKSLLAGMGLTVNYSQEEITIKL
jgi:hypothetical protein